MTPRSGTRRAGFLHGEGPCGRPRMLARWRGSRGHASTAHPQRAAHPCRPQRRTERGGRGVRRRRDEGAATGSLVERPSGRQGWKAGRRRSTGGRGVKDLERTPPSLSGFVVIGGVDPGDSRRPRRSGRVSSSPAPGGIHWGRHRAPGDRGPRAPRDPRPSPGSPCSTTAPSRRCPQLRTRGRRAQRAGAVTLGPDQRVPGPVPRRRVSGVIAGQAHLPQGYPQGGEDPGVEGEGRLRHVRPVPGEGAAAISGRTGVPEGISPGGRCS